MEEASGLDLALFFEHWVRDDGQPDLRWTATVESPGDRPHLRLRLEQLGEAFEFPLQVTIEYADRTTGVQRVRVSRAAEDYEFELRGLFRNVRLNDDLGALCRVR
jgi:aminopeptidase N